MPGKFIEKWHVGRVGVTATKSEKKRSLFNSDVFANVIVVVVVSKARFC